MLVRSQNESMLLKDFKFICLLGLLIFSLSTSAQVRPFIALGADGGISLKKQYQDGASFHSHRSAIPRPSIAAGAYFKFPKMLTTVSVALSHIQQRVSIREDWPSQAIVEYGSGYEGFIYKVQSEFYLKRGKSPLLGGAQIGYMHMPHSLTSFSSTGATTYDYGMQEYQATSSFSGFIFGPSVRYLFPQQKAEWSIGLTVSVIPIQFPTLSIYRELNGTIDPLIVKNSVWPFQLMVTYSPFKFGQQWKLFDKGA